jgi:hypothetical protein
MHWLDRAMVVLQYTYTRHRCQYRNGAGKYDGNRFFIRWSLVCGPTHIFYFLR